MWITTGTEEQALSLKGIVHLFFLYSGSEWGVGLQAPKMTKSSLYDLCAWTKLKRENKLGQCGHSLAKMWEQINQTSQATNKWLQCLVFFFLFFCFSHDRASYIWTFMEVFLVILDLDSPSPYSFHYKENNSHNNVNKFLLVRSKKKDLEHDDRTHNLTRQF